MHSPDPGNSSIWNYSGTRAGRRGSFVAFVHHCTMLLAAPKPGSAGHQVSFTETAWTKESPHLSCPYRENENFCTSEFDGSTQGQQEGHWALCFFAAQRWQRQHQAAFQVVLPLNRITLLAPL